MVMGKLNELFKNTREIEPASRLESSILSRIETLKKRSLKRKLAFSYLGIALSGSATAYAGLALGRTFLASEFWGLLKLIFSDAGIVIQNWRGFSYSLLETMPIADLIAILIPVFVLVLFFRLFSRWRDKNNSSGSQIGQYA